MFRREQAVIAGLDVGSSKVACLIARVSGEGGLQILGIGHHVAQGIRAGVVTHMQLAEESLRHAISSAEDMARMNVERIVVNMTGAYLSSRILHPEMMIGGKPVTTSDLYRLAARGVELAAGEDGRVIYATPTGYSIDGMRGIEDPRGMRGERLEMALHAVTVPATAADNLSECLARCHLDVEDIVPSAYAAGLACLSADERALGTIIMDVGSISTDIAVFREGHCVYTAMLPLGGAHITQDVAVGLSLEVSAAERIKTLHGNVIGSARDERHFIELQRMQGGQEEDHPSIPLSALTDIIRPRVEEILEMARSKLEKAGYSPLALPIVLTGGSSQLAGLKELAGEMYGRRGARLGVPLSIPGMAESIRGAGFSTCIGLLLHSVRRARQEENLFLPRSQNVLHQVLRLFSPVHA